MVDFRQVFVTSQVCARGVEPSVPTALKEEES